jgi:Tfp pilus assembly protein PilF
VSCRIWLLAAFAIAAIVASTPADAPGATTDAPEIHLGKGYDALKRGRYDDAVSEFRAALRLDPKLVLRARFPLAVALFELN